jgi:arylsulfatase A-like enzyme
MENNRASVEKREGTHAMSRLFLFPAFVLLFPPCLVGAADRPNVVFIMADELGYFELSCMGNPNLKTPRIDQMAREGIRFTQALAGSSVCAPTRCCLMTGKHSGHTSVRSNGGGTPLRAGEETIASMLKKAGYATGGFGKWGCGGRGSTGVPEKHGFDTFLGYYDQVHAHSYYPPYIVRNSEEVPLAGNRGRSDGETYSHYVIFDAALDFIRTHQDQPFFCYLPVTPPHGIFDIPDSDPAWDLFKDQPWPETARRYAAMVSMVDRQVGEVLELLRELDLEKKTIVYFCGDNGGADYFRDPQHPRGFHGANKDPKTGAEFRGTKRTLYEGGLRIPMIVRWPEKISPGRVSDLLWYFPDVLPTISELTGTTPPADVDGISIVPELLGEETVGRIQEQHEYLYWELGGQTAIRMQHWKGIKPGPKRDWELYDLSSDISEEHDLAADHPELLAKLMKFAEQAHEDVQEGTFHNRTMHERDRQAKFGFDQRQQQRRPSNHLDRAGLIPAAKMTIVRVSSEARDNGKLATNAIDGDPRSHWHTQFGNKLAKHPHELVIDLGAETNIRGIRYLARQDAGWNGALVKCVFSVSNSKEDFGAPVAAVTFKKVKTSQEVTWDPVKGRYVHLKILSEVNQGPWASIAELGVIGKISPQTPSVRSAAPNHTRPNILWIFVEDLSPWIGCYGDEINKDATPNINALAARGVRFDRCFMPAPVCSACRSAIITGAMQTTTGTHQHRSSRTPKSAIHLPSGMKTIPELFRAHGYVTFNQGKDDYNFVYQRSDLYSIGNLKKQRKGSFYGKKGNPDNWSKVPKGSPFFGQIMLLGGKDQTKDLKDKADPASITLPPYLPDNGLFRKSWAHHYDTVRVTDRKVGSILQRLEKDGLLDNTILFFFSDHGNNHSLRHKQFCYEGGVHVPLVIAGPPDWLKTDAIRRDLVSGLDISATTLALAGIPQPDYFEGQDLFADNFTPRKWVISARDRCDYTIDRIRTVRTEQYRYIRNFLTDRPLLQPQYRDNRDYTQSLRKLYAEGKLNEVQKVAFFGKRPAEELYNIGQDPDQIRNLAENPAFAGELERHRGILDSWMQETDDKGQYPESENHLRAILDRWGVKCVNPEYNPLREPTP